MKTREQFLEVVRRYVEGAATAEETRWLEQALRSDPVFRRLFLRYVNVDAALGKGRVTVRQDEPVVVPFGASLLGRAAWWWKMGLAAAAALVLAGATWLWQTHSKGARVGLIVASADARVEVMRAGKRLALALGEDLKVGDEVMTGPYNLVLSYIEEETRIEVAAGTHLRVLDHRPGKRLQLLAGTLVTDIAPQPPGKPMVLLTPDAEALVLGTRVMLRVSGDSSTVEVDRGAVRVSRGRDGATALVAAGQRVSTDDVQLETKPLPPMPDRVVVGRRDLMFDFEDGKAGPPWRRGRVTQGPPREGSRWCVAAELYGGDKPHPTFGVNLRLPFAVRESSVLSFAYWAGPEITEFRIRAQDGVHKFGFTRKVQPSAHGQWVRVSVSLRELLSVKRDETGQYRSLAGILANTLSLDLIFKGGVPALYFDDIQLFDVEVIPDSLR